MHSFTNIALEGGGAKGVAYLGALKALDEMDTKDKNYIQKNIKNFAGTSAGAITALMLAVGFSSKEIYDVFYDIDYDVFFETPIDEFIKQISHFETRYILDYIDYVLRLISHYGLNKGDKFKNFLIDNVMVKKGFNADTTFSQLYKENGHSLYVYSLNVNTNSLMCFSYKKDYNINNDPTPDFNIIDAVTASMALPYVFQPKHLKVNESIDTFVDGGVVLNYPILFMDKDNNPNPDTIGFSLNKEELKSEVIDSLVTLSIREIQAIYYAQVIAGYSEPSIKNRTVYLDTSECSVIDFHIKKELKDKIINNAYNTTKKWLGG